MPGKLLQLGRKIGGLAEVFELLPRIFVGTVFKQALCQRKAHRRDIGVGCQYGSVEADGALIVALGAGNQCLRQSHQQRIVRPWELEINRQQQRCAFGIVGEHGIAERLLQQLGALEQLFAAHLQAFVGRRGSWRGRGFRLRRGSWRGRGFRLRRGSWRDVEARVRLSFQPAFRCGQGYLKGQQQQAGSPAKLVRYAHPTLSSRQNL